MDEFQELDHLFEPFVSHREHDRRRLCGLLSCETLAALGSVAVLATILYLLRSWTLTDGRLFERKCEPLAVGPECGLPGPEPGPGPGSGEMDVFIHSNGQKATYLAYDGVRKDLPPEAGQFGLQLYGIQAFHHTHCVYVLLESVGWARHNRPSQWNGDHIAHCLNTLTQAATCLADSRPFAYVVPGGHCIDGQQSWCSDFGALVEWVNDPVRDHNFHYELDSNDTDHFMPIYRNGSIAGRSVDKAVW
ncbi:hypothetical protein CCHL11_08489 [Colletotrichum chlorophyti]|uniref:Oxidase ustYa n=1 Tax=Colletotrichum chlorophyti TaxID=708187 RepID=A0A1Q8S656_9PEZI|nr:hypothetical protein CCHL11_08489 [Colletotrichum chlorophyti]